MKNEVCADAPICPIPQESWTVMYNWRDKHGLVRRDGNGKIAPPERTYVRHKVAGYWALWDMGREEIMANQTQVALERESASYVDLKIVKNNLRQFPVGRTLLQTVESGSRIVSVMR